MMSSTPYKEMVIESYYLRNVRLRCVTSEQGQAGATSIQGDSVTQPCADHGVVQLSPGVPDGGVAYSVLSPPSSVLRAYLRAR